MTKYFVIVLSFLLTSTVLAQDRVDLLYLKSGETLRGTVHSYQRGESMIFILSTGDTVRSRDGTMDLIKGIRIGKRNRKGFQQRTAGFWHQYELGANFENESGTALYPQGAIQATVGYQWSKMKKVGLGIGLEAMEDFNMVPVYVSIGGDWFEGRKVTPYHFVNVGTAFASGRSYVFEDRFREINGGFRFNPGIGIKIHRRRAFYTISAGYLMQNIEYQESFWGGWWIDRAGITQVSRSFRRMSLRFGIGF